MHVFFGFRDHVHALRYVMAGDFNQGLDIFCRFGATMRQASDLTSHHRKPFTMIPRSCRFNGGVKRQNIGLESDTVNQRDNLCHLLGAVGNRLHIVRNLPH